MTDMMKELQATMDAQVQANTAWQSYVESL